MYPNSWNNRHVSWQFIPAPNYTGDINIGAIQGAQTFWPAIAVSHLANGIHGVQYFANGQWVNATMDSDQGDDYIIGPTTGAGTAGTQYEIQVTDASGNLINNGRVYSFTLPASCGTSCSAPYTPITYTTSTGPSPSPSPTPTTTSPSPSPSPTTTSPSPSPSPTPTTTGKGTCTLTSSVTNSWGGSQPGFQLQFTVTAGSTPITSGWSVGFSFADTSETIATFWNLASLTQSGAKLSGVNASYNGSIAAGNSTTFGMTVNGANSSLSGLTCTAT
jgi:hypothetical protein